MKRIMLFSLLLLVLNSLAGEDVREMGVVGSAPGGLYVFRGGEWMEVKRGDIIFSGERFKTPYDGFASIFFVNSAKALFKPMSECEIDVFAEGSVFDIKMRLAQGGVYAESGRGRLNISYFETTASCEKETSLFAEQRGDSLNIHITGGKCSIENDVGGAELVKGESGVSVSGCSPYKMASEPPQWNWSGESSTHRIIIEFENSEGDTVCLEVETE